MKLKKIDREYYKQAFELPVSVFIEEFVLKYYKEGKFTLSEFDLIKATLEYEFSKIIYCDTNTFLGDSFLKLMPNTYDDEDGEVLFSHVLDGITKNNCFINAIDTLTDIFDTKTDFDTFMSFRENCFNLKNLFYKLESLAISDFKKILESRVVKL